MKLLAHGFETEGELFLDLLGHLARNANTPGICKLLQPRCYIHSFTVAIVTLDNHLSQIDANADFDPILFRNARVALHHAALERYRAFDGIDDAAKFRQQAIAHELEDAAVMLADFRLQQVPEVVLVCQHVEALHVHEIRTVRLAGAAKALQQLALLEQLVPDLLEPARLRRQGERGGLQLV